MPESAVCSARPVQSHALFDLATFKESTDHPSFTKRQYAPVEIVQTEMKGFGLRAADDIPR